GVAIGRALGDGSRRDRATSAAAVLHHDLLAERAGHLLGNDTRQRIVAAAGGKRHHQRDRTRGIILRPDPQRAGGNRCERRNRDRCRSRTGAQQSHGHQLCSLLRERRERPRRRRAEQRDELTPFHVWMAPAWQEIIWRAAQRSLAVMCPACSRSPEGLLALMESANRGLITRAGSMSR